MSNLLANKSLSEGLDSVTSESLKNIAQTDNQVISLELYTTVSHKTNKKLFFYENRSHPDYDSILMAKEEFALFVNNQLFENVPKKLHWSSCNNIITNMTVQAASDIKYILVTHTSKPELIIAENAKGYLLLLLFLISTLISLLIINMISMGIKKPLEQLMAGFDETASGKIHIVSEDQGDKSIQKITRAFNKMSLNLSRQQKQLTETNRELLISNKSLLDSESILTALVDYSPDAIIVTDLEDQILIYNHSAARDFGYHKRSMIGKRISNLLPLAKLRNEPSKVDCDFIDGQEIICKRRDGSRFPAMLVHTPLGSDKNKPIALLYFIKNIAESDKYKDMILKLDRIASKGKMARDIAHEINNYLAILQGNLELLPIIMAGKNPEKTTEKIEVMKNTVNNITTFTDGLSRFSDDGSEFEKEDLNQLVENLLAFVKPQNKFDNIFIGTNLSEDLPMVEIDTAQIQHLIVNLISNSAEALVGLKGKHWIVVSTALDESSDHFNIKVADSGQGIADEYLDRLFISRFSSRREGTGMGLLTCKNIVNNHKGEISYHSSDESKAIFIIK
ncbi:MAG: PAS domain S-box protein, partial [candidate division Zixibacteria bacterium]|nr:PAS domain S-box protein [candidate division Zixibacteria bacterium]